MIGNGVVDPYWDNAEEKETVYLYLGWSGRVLCYISLLETVW